ncbi:MAG: butyrate kinase [Tidjanibacter sp.]|nr:butyrate kinase [Tidjanibacter sp.]
MNKKILVINPGSTSTKIAVYDGEQELFTTTLRHSTEEIGAFATIPDQKEFRRSLITEAMESAGVKVADLGAVIGRGGLVKHIPSGVYKVGAQMIDDILHRPLGQHASNLGALIAADIAAEAGIEAYIADPVVVDEMEPVARLTGWAEVERTSIFHALNQKAVARAYADSIGKPYEALNLIVVHMGGGISVGAHRAGRVIDVNNALDGEGPFSPERVGTLPALSLAKLCYSGKYTLAEIAKKINGLGGMNSLIGTNNVKQAVEDATAGDTKAKAAVEAMCYNVGKEIGQMAAVLCGKVDAIILTGGIAYNESICHYITNMVGFIAPVVVMPGENEMEALANNALRVLEGKLEAKVYE